MTWLLRHLLLPVVLTTTIVASQSKAGEPPTFDVVSVKPNRSGDAAMRLDVQPGGRLIAANVPLKHFIRAAYTLQLYQIVDAPSWVDAERFDITAVSGRDVAAPSVWKPGQFAPVQLMMQAFLADRFHMRAHTEPREAQTYALVERAPASSTGKLTPAEAPCPPDCGMQIGQGTLTARNIPLPQFAELLSQLTGRVVVDETGLTGRFDWCPLDAGLSTGAGR